MRNIVCGFTVDIRLKLRHGCLGLLGRLCLSLGILGHLGLDAGGLAGDEPLSFI